jgi:hypothetical protein
MEFLNTQAPDRGKATIFCGYAESKLGGGGTKTAREGGGRRLKVGASPLNTPSPPCGR